MVRRQKEPKWMIIWGILFLGAFFRNLARKNDPPRHCSRYFTVQSVGLILHFSSQPQYQPWLIEAYAGMVLKDSPVQWMRLCTVNSWLSEKKPLWCKLRQEISFVLEDRALDFHWYTQWNLGCYLIGSLMPKHNVLLDWTSKQVG